MRSTEFFTKKTIPDLTDETFPTFTSLSPADLVPAPDPAPAALAAPAPASDLCFLANTKQCLPRCEGCGIFDRCFQYPRRELERDCGCQFALLHKADVES